MTNFKEVNRQNLIKAIRECFISNESDWDDPEICDKDDSECLGLYLGEKMRF